MSKIPPTFEWPVQFLGGVTVFVYVCAIATGNASQVDRLWTFLPTIYTAYFALLPFWPQTPVFPGLPFTPAAVHPYLSESYSPRALVMLGLTVLWMFRLSYNTFRRGLFSFWDEDYRWPILRAKLPRVLYEIINLVFIAIIQNIILFLLGVPTHTAALQPHTSLALSDYALAATALTILALEFTADNQQYGYQTFKHGGTYNNWPGANIKWTEDDKKRGFVTRGLWAWVRHPNFACEQSFWTVITLFPILSPTRTPPMPFVPGSWFQPIYPLIPCLVLNALFFSSTLFSESISAGKYPEYKSYQKRVSMFFPPGTLIRGLVYKSPKLDQDVWGAVATKKIQ